MDAPLLQMRGMRKSYGGVEVLKSVDFEVRAGEVHALCGENGAGKSTLMNLLAGVVAPDGGEITLGNTRCAAFAHAHAAQTAGVGMVFQERSLFAPLTVAENIYAGRQPTRSWGVIDHAQMIRNAERLLAETAPDISPRERLQDLSPAHQQMVEITKALSLDARILILDEPTAALTETETTRLFDLLRRLRSREVGIVYISHRLEEVFQISDRVTVLKDGAWQATLPTHHTTPDELIRLMVGRGLAPSPPPRANTVPAGPPLLEVRRISDPPGLASPCLQEISFQVREGEIIGLAGLAGAGRTETALTLFGARRSAQVLVEMAGQPVSLRSPSEAIDAGLGYVSEDRKESGLFLDMSLRRNVSAASLTRFGRWWFDDAGEKRVAEERRTSLRIACRDVEQDTAHLSGGNQQKVLLARWLQVDPRILIVDEPTRGVDVGAKAEVHRLLRDFAARPGHAVLVISSDLPEILSLADRIYVMRAGCIAGELSRAEASEEAVMRLAAARQSPAPLPSSSQDRLA
ncbi:MAG: sugar ABC transporter ATP-binding protein [Verrucomicrobiales bacterium]|nr:sugar ABC transporter ATP-binding protein [Verrucomicrobiales bacterium]